MQTSPLIIWQWFQSHCQLCYWSGRLCPQMDTTASETTTFRFLAQMEHNGGHKHLEGTTHFSCLECNCSHQRSTHIVFRQIFHLLKLMHLITSALLSSKHQLWYFKACTTNHTNHASCSCYYKLLNVSLKFPTMHAHMQNPTLQLTSVLWWLVTVKIMKFRLNGRYTVLIQNQQHKMITTTTKKIHYHTSSAGSSSCPTWFSTDWVSPPLPHFWRWQYDSVSTEHNIYILHAEQCHCVCL